MKRLLAALAITAVAATGAALPPPEPGPVPEFASVAPDEGFASSDEGGVWYCPWMHSGAEFATSLMVISEPGADVLISLPNSLPNEPPVTEATDLPSPGSREIDLSNIILDGEAPGFVEFSEGPAAAAATVFGETSVAGDSCTAFLPKLWHVTGGTTRVGRTTLLRLFNPFLTEAKVTITGYSELGPEALPELDIVDVAARSWETIDLNVIVPFLDELALVVSTEGGSGIIPALDVSSGIDDATWPGTGLSTLWEFPAARQAGLTSSIVVTNPGDTPTELSVDIYTQNAPFLDLIQRTIDPGTPVRILVGDGISGNFGVRLRSVSPVSAVIVAEDMAQSGGGEGSLGDEGEAPVERGRIAGTTGVQPSTGWMLPGAGAILEAEDNSIWLLNTSDESVTATITPVGLDTHAPDKVVIAAGTIVRVRLEPDVSIAGYLVESSIPITAAWSTQTPDAVAFYSGVPFES